MVSVHREVRTLDDWEEPTLVYDTHPVFERFGDNRALMLNDCCSTVDHGVSSTGHVKALKTTST